MPKERRTRSTLIVAPLLALLLAGAAPANAQPASLSGSVLADSSERPLRNVEVTLSDLRLAARTDSLGRFLLSGVTPGSHVVLVRLPGYFPFSAEVTFVAGQKFEADFLLKPITTELEKVEVTARASGPWAIKLQDFEERRRTGIGKFLTADVFEAGDGRPPSSLLAAHIAGLRIVQSNGHRYLASSRVGTSGSGRNDPKPPPACYMQIILNGRIEFSGLSTQEVFDFDSLNSKDIIGLEFYTTATTPLQYKGTSGTNCGTVVIWTKGG